MITQYRNSTQNTHCSNDCVPDVAADKNVRSNVLAFMWNILLVSIRKLVAVIASELTLGSFFVTTKMYRIFATRG
jgi:hypothetical protein